MKHFTETFSFSCVFSFRVALWSVPCLHPIKLLHSVIPLQSPSLPSHWPKPVKFVLTCKAPSLLFVPLYSPHRGGCSLPFRFLGLFHARCRGGGDRFCSVPCCAAPQQRHSRWQPGEGLSWEAGQVLHHHLSRRNFLRKGCVPPRHQSFPQQPPYSPGWHQKCLGAGLFQLSSIQRIQLFPESSSLQAFHSWALDLVAHSEDKLDIIYEFRLLCINVGKCELCRSHLANHSHFLH